jgi:hypothetical protein
MHCVGMFGLVHTHCAKVSGLHSYCLSTIFRRANAWRFRSGAIAGSCFAFKLLTELPVFARNPMLENLAVPNHNDGPAVHSRRLVHSSGFALSRRNDLFGQMGDRRCLVPLAAYQHIRCVGIMLLRRCSGSTQLHSRESPRADRRTPVIDCELCDAAAYRRLSRGGRPRCRPLIQQGRRLRNASSPE